MRIRCFLMIKYETSHHVYDHVQQQKGRSPVKGSTKMLLRLALLAGKNNNYLVSSTFGVDKHKQRLHELRGKRFHQEGLPAAILKL